MDRFLSEAERLIGAVADAARREGVIKGLERALEMLSDERPWTAGIQDIRAELERLKAEG